MIYHPIFDEMLANKMVLKKLELVISCKKGVSSELCKLSVSCEHNKYHPNMVLIESSKHLLDTTLNSILNTDTEVDVIYINLRKGTFFDMLSKRIDRQNHSFESRYALMNRAKFCWGLSLFLTLDNAISFCAKDDESDNYNFFSYGRSIKDEILTEIKNLSNVEFPLKAASKEQSFKNYFFYFWFNLGIDYTTFDEDIILNTLENIEVFEKDTKYEAY